MQENEVRQLRPNDLSPFPYRKEHRRVAEYAEKNERARWKERTTKDTKDAKENESPQ